MTLNVDLGKILTTWSHETVRAGFSTPLHIYLNHSIFQETKTSHNMQLAKITSIVNIKCYNLTKALIFKGKYNLYYTILSSKSSKRVKQQEYIYIYSFQTLFHYRLLQDIEYSSQCCIQ